LPKRFIHANVLIDELEFPDRVRGLLHVYVLLRMRVFWREEIADSIKL